MGKARLWLLATVPFVCGLMLLLFSANCEQARMSEAAASGIIEARLYPDLQAALDAVPEKGGLVKLPPGEFEITKPLELTRGDTRVEGSGNATHIINRNESGEPAFVVRPANRQV